VEKWGAGDRGGMGMGLVVQLACLAFIFMVNRCFYRICKLSLMAQASKAAFVEIKSVICENRENKSRFFILQNRIYYCSDCGQKKVGAKEIVNHSRSAYLIDCQL
jgi:hypothetical protein